MDIRELLGHVDHTLLAQTATWDEIRAIVDDGVKYGTASVCIPPCHVQQAAQYAAGRVKICTVIGFPNGYNTTAIKCLEASEALQNGADEIDMVINLGWVKEGLWEDVLREIASIKQVCGQSVLKVIVEACLLTREEKIRMCEIVTEAGADYIKTSTGFSTGGATFEDIELFVANVGPGVEVKASGGISSLEDGIRFLELGADRLGTSKIVKIAKVQE